MKLDKKVCRKFVKPEWSTDLNHGLFCAEQTQYIVKSEVRNVNHRRVPILRTYGRRKVAAGETRPLQAMFQSRRQHFTLARRDSDSTFWRSAAFDNLGRYYLFENKCALYFINDERKVMQFCKTDQKDGLSCPNSLQSRMMYQSILQKRYKMQREVIEKMETVPELPRGIKGWIDREIMPTYISYTYSKDRKEMGGYCTACEQAVRVSEIKHNAEGSCPHCNKAVTYKNRGRHGTVIDRKTIQVLQKVSEKELVARFVKIYRKYPNAGVLEDSLYESTRTLINSDRKEHRKSKHSYHQFSCQDITPWEKGNRPVFSKQQYNFNADHNGYLYDRNLELTLENAPRRYSQLERYYQTDRIPFYVIDCLQRYLDCPVLEYMVKLDLYRSAADIVSPDYCCCALSQTINEKGKSIQEVLGLSKSHLPMLQEANPGNKQLTLIKKYLKDHIHLDIILFNWCARNGVNRLEDLTVPLQYMTAYKLIRYVDEQFEIYRAKNWATAGYYDMESFLNSYENYLSMCKALEYDLSNSSVLYPANLPKAHDRVNDLSGKKQVRMHEGRIRKLYEKLSNQYAFSKCEHFITLPHTVKEIIEEGHKLRHCIGTYVRMVVKGQCPVFFVRRVNEPEKSLCTIELSGAEVGQMSMFAN